MKKLCCVFVLLAGCSTTPPEEGSGELDFSEPSSASSAPRRGGGRQASVRESKKGNYTAQLSGAKQSGTDQDMTAAASAALTADSHDLSALNALAMHHLRKGRVGLAKIILQRAYAHHERSAALQNNLGLIYLAEQDQQAAIMAFKEALSLDPRLASASANLGSIYARYGDCERALPLLEVAIRYAEGDPSVSNNLAMCLGMSGKSRRARELYERVLSQNPRNVTALLNYAILLIERDKNVQDGSGILNRLKSVGPPADMNEKISSLSRKVQESANR